VLLEEGRRAAFMRGNTCRTRGHGNEEGMYGPWRSGTKGAGAPGLALPGDPRKNTSGVGGTFAHDAGDRKARSAWPARLRFVAPLHSGIVAPYILHYALDEQEAGTGCPSSSPGEAGGC